MRFGIALVVFGLAGCATAGNAPSDTPTITSASASPQSSITAEPSAGGDELTGFLGADSIEGGCAYLRAEDGTRYEVVYPPGWTINRSSATLRDPSGTIVASAGDVITVRGREAKDMVSFCQIGPIFQATEVVSVE